MSQPPISRARLIAAASLLGSAAAVIAITGVGPVPSVFQLSSASRNAPAEVTPLVTGGSSLTSDDSPKDTTVDGSSTTIDGQGEDQPSAAVAGQSTTTVDDNGTEVSDDNGTEVSDDDATEVDDDATDTTVDDSTDTTVDDSTDTTVDDNGTADTSGPDGSSSDTSGGSGHD